MDARILHHYSQSIDILMILVCWQSLQANVKRLDVFIQRQTRPLHHLGYYRYGFLKLVRFHVKSQALAFNFEISMGFLLSPFPSSSNCLDF